MKRDMDIPSIAGDINLLGSFLGVRSIPALTRAELKTKYGFEQADVMVLFGGSILSGGDLFAQAIRAGVARKYVIVGGAGHTTPILRSLIHAEIPSIETENESEAIIFDRYINARYGLRADALETESTNCGNNITNLLALLDARDFACRSIILMQDATMQRRMHAGMMKHRPHLTVIDYAAYQAEVTHALTFAEPIHGMWDMDAYVRLLMGEIPRLTDDENGYGPSGKNFIAHVDVPEEVQEAFIRLKTAFPESVRTANPEFATQ